MFSVVKNISNYLRKYKRLTFLFLLCAALDLIFISIAPLSFTYIIDYAVEPKNMDMFLFIVQILALLGVVCTIAGIISDFILSQLNAKVESDLRHQLFRKLQELHIDYYEKKRSGDMISLFSIDLPTISGAMTSVLTTGIQSFIVVIISMGVLLYLQWSMALLILIGSSIILLGPLLLNKRAEKSYEQYKEQVALLTSEIQENVKAQKVIKGFNLQQLMLERFTKRVKQLFKSSYSLNMINAQLNRVPMISLLFVNFTIICFGSYLALKGQITVGALVAFYTMYISMGNSVFSLTLVLPIITDAKVSLDRVNAVLTEKRFEGPSSSGQHALNGNRLQIEVDSVSFGYSEDKLVLRQINMFIEAGKQIAFVGSSGSGKSTMLQLLLGFYEPQQGFIKINDVKLAQLNMQSYRDHIAVVFQDNFLFQGTILENIKMGKQEASFEQIVEAAKQAEIHQFIVELPNGYETEVLDEGSNFSGGQRQRLAVARALLRDPAILFLDEATSALDPMTEASINATFQKLAHERTVITVTHRLATIANADQIYVFDRGRVVEHGEHQQLLEREGIYHQLWEKQSGLSLSEQGDEVMIDAARLSKLQFFGQVDRAILKSIAALFNTERFEKGETIMQEGESGEKFYILVRGRVEVLKQGASEATAHSRVAILEDGDHFGEIALLENIPRTATIKTLTPCIVITLQRKVLHHILSEHPEINEYVRAVLQKRMS